MYVLKMLCSSAICARFLWLGLLFGCIEEQSYTSAETGVVVSANTQEEAAVKLLAAAEETAGPLVLVRSLRDLYQAKESTALAAAAGAEATLNEAGIAIGTYRLLVEQGAIEDLLVPGGAFENATQKQKAAILVAINAADAARLDATFASMEAEEIATAYQVVASLEGRP